MLIKTRYLVNWLSSIFAIPPQGYNQTLWVLINSVTKHFNAYLYPFLSNKVRIVLDISVTYTWRNSFANLSVTSPSPAPKSKSECALQLLDAFKSLRNWAVDTTNMEPRRSHLENKHSWFKSLKFNNTECKIQLLFWPVTNAKSVYNCGKIFQIESAQRVALHNYKNF